jgi:RimJ/RimL family protein N-acetyltransferase
MMVLVQLCPSYPIMTPRLSLRPLTVDDRDALLAYRGRADVCRYLPFEPMSVETLRARLARDLSTTAITEPGQSLTLGVRFDDKGDVIGDVVLFFHNLEHGAGELGYVFAPEASGHGYASEACAAVLALAFDQLGLHRVIARMDARNDASTRLAVRLGMRQEAHLVRSAMFKGEWSDELVYAMLAEDWPDSAAHQSLRPQSPTTAVDVEGES